MLGEGFVPVCVAPFEGLGAPGCVAGVWPRFVLRRRVGWRLLPFGSMLFLSASDGASLSFAPDLVQILPLRCSLVAFLLTYKLMVAEVDHLRW